MDIENLEVIGKLVTYNKSVLKDDEQNPVGDMYPIFMSLPAVYLKPKNMRRRIEFSEPDGAAAAATSWGSGPGLVGGARPPSTAEITFHAAIRAAVKLEPEQELGTAAPSSPSKYVAPKVFKNV